MNACAGESNAPRVIRFHAPPKHSQDVKTGPDCDPYLLRASVTGDFHAFIRKMAPSIARRFFLTSMATVLLPAHAALASQGPGGGPGTASSFTQLAMAILVYGTSALVVGSGLIGALRKH
jgi:hypothetical protein